MSSAPPPGAKLGDKVLTVGGIGGAGVSTRGNVVMGTKTASGVAKTTSRFRGRMDEEVNLLLCPGRERRRKDGKTARRVVIYGSLLSVAWRQALAVMC